MSCPGLHCPGCKEAGGLGAAGLVLAVVLGGGALVSWALANLELIAAGFSVMAAAVLTLTVRAVRRELREPTWHPEDDRAPGRVNAPAPVPALTTEQITGLAELGQAIHDVRVHGAWQRVIEGR